jgi:hypothetical protein
VVRVKHKKGIKKGILLTVTLLLVISILKPISVLGLSRVEDYYNPQPDEFYQKC